MTSPAVATGQGDGQRDTAAVGQDVVLGARPSAVDRAPAGFGPPFKALMCELSLPRPRPVQLPSGVQLHQQGLVQGVPHAGLVPVPQPAPTGHARAEPQLTGQELPADPGVQHEQDPAQDFAVVQPVTARMVSAPLDLRQQRLDPLPQPVGNDPRGLLALPHGPTTQQGVTCCREIEAFCYEL
ncbi:hypothetical protein GCM10009550_65990 [Actinocorallia libanotica]|uniref:Uncharacterized protein n=1 Tax=Actinocorallia libanotica TaxID=46162 RepID=A0ABN1RVU1_9ACTN